MKVCRKCGGSEFYKYGECKPCAKILAKKRYDRNNPRPHVEKTNDQKTCRKCGSIEFYKNGKSLRCKACDLERAKKWYEKNHVKALETRAKYKSKNPEKIKNARIIYRAKNSEEIKANAINYYKKNPDIFRINKQRRRTKKLQAIPKWFGELDELIMSEAIHLCVQREKTTGIKWHVDHQVPLQSKLVCGFHIGCNIAVITAKANKSKSNRYWPDMP